MEKLDSLGIKKFTFAPETTGKRSQLGSLDEIIEICRSFPHFAPTIDFAHVHARGRGCVKGADEYHRILSKLEDELGAMVKKTRKHSTVTSPGLNTLMLVKENTMFSRKWNTALH